MKETREILLADYNDVIEKLKVVNKDDNAFGDLLNERRSIRNDLVKMEEIDSENRKEKIRNIIGVGTFTITSTLGIWSLLRTLKFDESATVTSTVGRNIVSETVLKMFKK